MHEVAEGVQSLRLPVERSLLLVHRRPVPVLLGVEGLEVVHRSRHQVAWKKSKSWVNARLFSCLSPEFSNRKTRCVDFPFRLTSHMQTVKGRTGSRALLITRLDFAWGFTWRGVTYPGCRQAPERLQETYFCKYGVYFCKYSFCSVRLAHLSTTRRAGMPGPCSQLPTGSLWRLPKPHSPQK